MFKMKIVYSKSQAFKDCWAYVKNLICESMKAYGWTLRKLFARHLGSFMRKVYKTVEQIKSESKSIFDFVNRYGSH